MQNKRYRIKQEDIGRKIQDTGCKKIKESK
jgi:hypothetical protein